MSTDFFSSLNGKFDLNSSMSSLYGDYNTIKSGAYGTLMKSYVKKVGNQAALKAYQDTGSTTGTDNSALSSKKSSVAKSNFLDNYFKEKSATKTTNKSDSDASSDAVSSTTDKYEKYKSSWLDNQLKQYDKDANKTTAADASVSVDTTI